MSPKRTIKQQAEKKEKKKKSAAVKKLTHEEIVNILVTKASKIKDSRENFIRSMLEKMINEGIIPHSAQIRPRLARAYLGIMFWETNEKEKALDWIASAGAFYEAALVRPKDIGFAKKLAEEAGKQGEFLQSAEIISQESYPLDLKEKEKYIKKMSVKAFKENKKTQLQGFNTLLYELRKRENDKESF